MLSHAEITKGSMDFNSDKFLDILSLRSSNVLLNSQLSVDEDNERCISEGQEK